MFSCNNTFLLQKKVKTGKRVCNTTYIAKNKSRNTTDAVKKSTTQSVLQEFPQQDYCCKEEKHVRLLDFVISNSLRASGHVATPFNKPPSVNV